MIPSNLRRGTVPLEAVFYMSLNSQGQCLPPQALAWAQHRLVSHWHRACGSSRVGQGTARQMDRSCTNPTGISTPSRGGSPGYGVGAQMIHAFKGALYLCTAPAIPGLDSDSQLWMWQAMATRCLVWGGGV